MCENPLLIMSQSALIFLKEAQSVYFYDNLEDSLSNIYTFLQEYKNYDSEILDEVVNKSYFYYNGVKHPIFCLLPCSRCKYCRSNYKKEIENRAIIEASNSGCVIFYTLTYSDTFVPSTGLRRSDVSQAFKRLRIYISRYISKDIHFTQLYVGEYGTDPKHSLRPHYHGLLFFDKYLTPSEIESIRSIFLPTQSAFKQQFERKHIPEFLKRGLIKINPYTKEVIFNSPFYDQHPDLCGFWPYGLLFDFQVAKNPVALVRYVTKYITKNIAVSDTFPILKERDEAHYEPFFIQMPKKIGLACKYIDQYKDYILNSGSPTIQVRCSLGKNTKIYRISIPHIYIRKLFPSVGSVVPNCMMTSHLIASVLDSLQKLHIHSVDLKSVKVFHPLAIPSPGNDIFDTLLQLQIERFEPYVYLTYCPLKRKDRLKIEYLTTWILAPYHNSDYQTILESNNYPPEWELDIFKIFDELFEKLSPDCTFESYKKLTFAKMNYYSQLQIPDMPYKDRKLRKDLEIDKDRTYVANNMIYSPFNYIQ